MQRLTQTRAFPANDSRIDFYLLSDGTVLIAPGYGFTGLYEECREGISGLFDAEGFDLWEWGKEPQSYEYHFPYPYKQMPVFRAWLIQQELQLPVPLSNNQM
jgi:hypothetical protein